MEISESVKELYDYVETERWKNKGKLTSGQAGNVLDQLFAIHRQLIIKEIRPVPDPKSNVIKLDAKRLAQGGTIKTYTKPTFLTPLKKLFKRRIK